MQTKKLWSNLLFIIFISAVIGARNLTKRVKRKGWIRGIYLRNQTDGKAQTNLNRFFDSIPLGEKYRDAVLGIQTLTIVRKKHQPLRLTTNRIIQGKPSNQTISFNSGEIIYDPFINESMKIKTVITVKPNRIIFDRDMKGTTVFQVMHFSKQGCRTTYYTSDDYGIDFLRRK